MRIYIVIALLLAIQPALAQGTGYPTSVNSVGLITPPEFIVENSPIVNFGNLTVLKAAQPANYVYAGPASGSPTQPTFRLLVPADIPGGGGGNNSVVFLGGPSGAAYSQAPTSGTLTDEYWHAGDYTTTGSITSTRLRLHINGNCTINNPITATTEMLGGNNFAYGCGSLPSVAGSGHGLGGGGGAFSSGNANGQNGGAGGSFGGQGGSGGNDDTTMAINAGGNTYHISQQFSGSGGGAGGCPGSPASIGLPFVGGDGGGGIYLEVTGNCTINANITAGGDNGTNSDGDLGPGGGGSGGAIEIRCGGILTIDSGSTISANGGTGGEGGYLAQPANAGGGGGGYIRLRYSSITNNGTVQALGGAAGALAGSVDPARPATAGGTGIIDSHPLVWAPPIHP